MAEQIVFGDVTTGAANDLAKVYDVSRKMVAEYGMGTQISSRLIPVDDYSVSDATRRMVDEEQQELTDMAWRRAKKLIEDHRPILEQIASELLDQRGARARDDRADHGRAPAATPRSRSTGLPDRHRVADRRRPSGSSESALARLAAVLFGRIDHIGVAVEDIDAAMELYARDFQMREQHRETVEEQGVEAVLLEVGEGHVELIRPLGPDTGVAKFIAQERPRAAPRGLRDRGHRLDARRRARGRPAS